MQIKTSLLGLTASLFLSAAAFGQAPDGDSARPMDRGAFRGNHAERGVRDQDGSRRGVLRERLREKLQDARGGRQGSQRGMRGMRGERQEFGRQGGQRGMRGERQEFGRQGSQRGMRGERQEFGRQGGQRGGPQGFERPNRGAERFGPRAGVDQGSKLQSKLEALKAERRALKEKITKLKERRGNIESDKPNKPRKKGDRKKGNGGQSKRKKHKQGGGPVGR